LTAVDTLAGGDPSVETDRIGELAARMRVLVGRPVDALQVAAALEAEGIVDRTARDRYGHGDVFDLAEELFARLDTGAAGRGGHPVTGAGRRAAVRDVSHGLVYLLPAALLPTLPALVGVHRLVLALVIASGLGWVWSAGSAWLAYRLLGRGLHASAGRVLWVAALSGTAVGSAAGAVTAAVAGGGGLLVGIVAALLAFQMASTVALVYRREAWLVACMAPGVAAGIAHVVDGRPGAALAAGVGAGSIALTLAVASWQTTRTPARGAGWSRAAPVEPALHRAVRPELAQLGGVLLYAALSAGFLLHVDARYLSGRPGLAVAAAPLVLGMGLVEWRTRRFHDQATGLLHRSSEPRRFAVAVWFRLAGGLLTVLTAIGVLAAGLLVVLDREGLLDRAVAVLIAAHVAVGGAYFLAFVVAGQSRYGRLCTALAAALAVDVAAVRLWPGGVDPLRDGIALLACALLLQALLAGSLLRRLGQVWRYSGTPT
jgi:hypothetical protein